MMMFRSSAERAMVRAESRGRPLWHLAARRPALASAALEKLPAGCAHVCAKSESRCSSSAQRAGPLLALVARANCGPRSALNQNESYDFNLNKAAIGKRNVVVARLRPIRCVALAPLAARPRGRDLQLADAVQHRRAAPSATVHC